MDDAFFVRRREALRYLQCVVECFAAGERSGSQPVAQGFALQQLGDDVGRPCRSPMSKIARIWDDSVQPWRGLPARNVAGDRDPPRRMREDFDRDCTF